MENNPEYYVVIPTRIVAARDISQTAKLLYGVITSFWQTYGVCWATNARLAQAMGDCDERTVSRAVAELKSHGYITSEKEGRSTRKIYLSMCLPHGQSIDNTVHTDTTILSNGVDNTVIGTPYIKKNNINNIINHQLVFVSWIQNVLENSCPREKKNELYARLMEYKDMRKEGNSPLNTERKINGLLNDLLHESKGNVDVMCEMLRKATNNCWKSVHGPTGTKFQAPKETSGRTYEEL